MASVENNEIAATKNATPCLPPGGLRALATDFDGTLAHDGKVSEPALQSVLRLKRADWRLIMVTGRELNSLKATFPQLGLFDLVVLENGAVLHEPATGRTEALAALPPPEFITRLIGKGMPVEVGKVIVATWEPHEAEVLAAIKELGLDLQVIFNKGAVMVLPSGVNKATGLRAALGVLGLELSQVAGVGDAENDHAFLDICGWSVAVANALPAVRAKVNHVTEAGHGDGVAELIECLLTPHPIQA
ncbi:HAD family hydrolase [Prosthecobacter sp.]|uniref:HAD family hydrolase n=1 Tax=Prosthecobacter sp. TaxID=1965333 RepID=UPI003784806C